MGAKIYKDKAMTTAEIEISISFNRVTFLPGSWDKRYARQWANQAESNPAYELTDKQSEWIYRLLYKYRRQLPDIYEKYKDHPLCCRKEKP